MATLIMFSTAMVSQQAAESLEQKPIELLPSLSDYNVFAGDPVALVPTNGFELYELSSGLFSDYAEKQRLIKIPTGSKLKSLGAGLPEFPDGTMLVKTFYYFHDKRDLSKGKRLIETRLMIKSKGRWIAGTYGWNPSATEALLIVKGSTTPVNWKDESGVEHSIRYQVPAASECNTCHQLNNQMTPIGFKVRNLNRDVKKDNKYVNQLAYFQTAGLMGAVSNPTDPFIDGKAGHASPGLQARAYLDINCGHCHQEKGFCSGTDLKLTFEATEDTELLLRKSDRIKKLMSNGRMPMKGTTVIDQEGVAMIAAYLTTIKKSQ